MYFNCHIQIIITSATTGDEKELTNIMKVAIKNDAQHIGSTCDIDVPLNCRIKYKDQQGYYNYLTAKIITSFQSGDIIKIYAWYDGYNKLEIFSGFVVDFIEGNPTTIKCMDYIYTLNLGIFGSKMVGVKKNKTSNKKGFSAWGASYPSIKLKDLLQHLIDFTNDQIDISQSSAAHLTLANDIFDMTLSNLTFATMSPAAILEWLKKEMGFNISLQGNQLYCNIASALTTETVNVVKFASDRNIHACGLQKNAKTNSTLFQNYKLRAWFENEDGTKNWIDVGSENGLHREVFYYRIPNNQALRLKMANAALDKCKINHYTGSLGAYLYPICDLYWKVIYTDIRYPERSGNYTITGIDTDIDHGGYRRTIKMAYLSEIQA